MRNELYLEYEGGSYQYFDTNNSEWDSALREFENIMTRVGLNMDNMHLIKIQVRRKSDDNIIDWNRFENGNWIR